MKKYLPVLCVSVLFLRNTHGLLSLDDGLGFTESLPVFQRLDSVGLEEFHQTPTMVSFGGRRLMTYWAWHFGCLYPRLVLTNSF